MVLVMMLVTYDVHCSYILMTRQFQSDKITNEIVNNCYLGNIQYSETSFSGHLDHFTIVAMSSIYRSQTV